MNAPTDPARHLAAAASRDLTLVQAAHEWVLERVDQQAEREMLAHAAGVAAILLELDADPVAQASAWLYPFDDQASLEAIEDRFGDQVSAVSGSMRKLRRMRELHQHQGDGRDRDGAQRLETLRRMLLAMSVDIRVVMLRLASRLNSLRQHALAHEPAQASACRETLEVLAPLANRLGLSQLKWEMEDLAFRFLHADQYYEIARHLNIKRDQRVALVNDAANHLSRVLRAHNLQPRVSGRPKHIYSIWKKMRDKRLLITDIQDLLALRVVVESVEQCYEALDAVHALWQPLLDQYDDYISRPKRNGYQSLHTVVRAEQGVVIEVQVRTREMHDAAEYGAAAHWQYKEGVVSDSAQFDQRVALLRHLLDWQQEVGAALGASSENKVRDNHIYVLTPAARIMALPEGSTPIDFAYHLHTDLGHQCRGARVDGKMVPLSTPLQTGQTVEIVPLAARGARSDKAVGPSRDWLNKSLGFLGSRRAQNKVRQFFAAQEGERERAQGRALVERVLQREGRTQLSLESLATRLSFESMAQMFSAAAHGDLGPRAIEHAIRGDAPSVQPTPETTGSRSPKRRGTPDQVLLEGVGSLMTSMARCCNPIPGDQIAGYTTRGRGVKIHRQNCGVLLRLKVEDEARVLSASWRDAAPSESGGFRSQVVVHASWREGLSEAIVDIMARRHLEVLSTDMTTHRDLSQIRLQVEVPSRSVLRDALKEIRSIPEVSAVRRV
jgi:GTP pyrophosphokinase